MLRESQNKVYVTKWGAGPTVSFFTLKRHVVTFKRLCRGVLFRTAVDMRKREERVISSVSYYYYFFFYIISRVTFPLFNNI